MIALGPPIVVLGQDTWDNTELVGDKRDRTLRCRREVRRHKPQIPEGAQLEGISQTVAGFALALDFALIVLREQKLHRKVILRNHSGKALPAVPLGNGEK